MAEGEEETQEVVDHLLDLADLVHLFIAVPAERGDVVLKIQKIVEEHDMFPYYDQYLTKVTEVRCFEPPKLDAMKEANEAKLRVLEEAIDDAQKNFGESEVREAYVAKAQYLYTIGDKEASLSAWKETILKTVDLGRKIDIVFNLVRLGIAFADIDLTKAQVARASKMIDRGGDWERRNRLKVYEGALQVMTRRFSEAATGLMSALSTFGCYRLWTFRRYVMMTIASCLLTLERPKLKKSIIDSPDVLTVIDKLPNLRDLVRAFYACNYGQFLEKLVSFEGEMKRDRFLAPHLTFYSREMRIRAYSQFLQSYKSVTMESMAENFSVSVDFLDDELSRFIAFGRLNAKLDKVDNVINTTRQKKKNSQYTAMLKKGDYLLGRLQKLSRVVDL